MVYDFRAQTKMCEGRRIGYPRSVRIVGEGGSLCVCVKTTAGLQLTYNRTTCHSVISGTHGGRLSGPSSRVKQSRRNTT